MYLSAYVFLVVIGGIVLFWIRCRKKKLRLFERSGIPGPKTNFFTGNMKEFHEKRNQCFDEWLRKYGNIFSFFLGAKPFVMVYDLELIKLLQIKEFKTFPNRDLILPDIGIPHENIFNCILLRKDEEWKNDRSILSTCFSTKKIKTMSILTTEPIKILIEKFKEQNEEPFDVIKFYKNVTFDIICRSAFGITTNAQNQKSNRFVESLFRILDISSTDILSIISICFPEFEPIPTYLRLFLDMLKNTFSFPSVRCVFQTIEEIVNKKKNSKHHQPDLLQTMIEAEDDSDNVVKKLSKDSVIANSVLFMIAGYDTTSNTLSWCTHFLAHNPAVQEKIRQEITRHVKKERDIEYSDLSNFKYMDQVISETLRLSPLSITAMNRICSEDFAYKNMIIPKGVTVIVPVPILQKHPNYWKQPEKFDPERFSPNIRGNIDISIYQPFGAGPRMCIGKRFAKAVLKLILGNIIRTFKFEPCGDENMELEHALFIPRPKNGILVKAIPIKH